MAESVLLLIHFYVYRLINVNARTRNSTTALKKGSKSESRNFKKRKGAKLFVYCASWWCYLKSHTMISYYVCDNNHMIPAADK